MRAKAFTLIELLVVIGVIAVLLSVGIPSLIRAKWIAGEKVCSANLRSIHLGLTMYAQENRDFYPLEPTEHNPHPQLIHLLTGLQLTQYEHYYCPQAELSEEAAANPNFTPVGDVDTVIRTEANIQSGNISYLYFSFLDNKSYGGTSWRERQKFVPRHLKVDGAVTLDPARPVTTATPQERWVVSDFFRKGAPFPHARSHARGLNIGYQDGHVELMLGRPQDNYN